MEGRGVGGGEFCLGVLRLAFVVLAAKTPRRAHHIISLDYFLTDDHSHGGNDNGGIIIIIIP